ncbi:Gfo/Idh/MocA family protein [Microlunatus sp. GCM10028923]|uniref:Gfo/Idh/MocA family protein n=1 Tax=Microlunatus sp. GCM10028923 TaxID=3273400 RepID=UPI0036099D39
MPTGDPRLRAVFLGVTHPHARAWATAAARHAEVELVGAYDPDHGAAAEFARTYRCATLTEPAVDPAEHDLVIVDGRNDQARELALIGVRAGRPVFIEKTGGRSARELYQVAAEARDRDVITQLGYFLRYSTAVVEARELVAAGGFGRLSLARFHAAIPHQAWQSMAGWFGDPTQVVGPFTEAGCHLIDIVRMIFGDPQSVTAGAASWQQPPNHAEDVLAAILRYDGMIATVDFTAHEANPWNVSWGIELYGTTGTATFGLTPARSAISHGTHRWTEHSTAGGDEADHRNVVAAENEALMERGMDAFVEAVRGRAAVPVDAWSGAGTLSLIERILAAAHRGV